MYPKSIQKLIGLFSRFPTIGQRTASRFVFYLLKVPQEEIDELIAALGDLKKRIGLCNFCFSPFERNEEHATLCGICANKSRDASLLCIVEKESDLEALEKAHTYHGLYFILGGTVGMLKKQDLKHLRIDELKERLKHPEAFGLPSSKKIKEIIIATNPTTEGEATALYLERIFKEPIFKITRLGRGLPIGAEMEYADPETLQQSLQNRR